MPVCVLGAWLELLCLEVNLLPASSQKARLGCLGLSSEPGVGAKAWPSWEAGGGCFLEPTLVVQSELVCRP